MNDAKLLELAAKAAGLGHCWFDEFNDDYVVYHADIDCNCSWNPLEDDGDALRLAVKLRLEINFSSNGVYVGRDPKDPDGDWVFESLKLAPLGFDEYAATRRAIVRAAASIGEQMK